MVDSVETDLPVQIARITQSDTLPKQVVGSLPFGFEPLFERPRLNLWKDPVDAAEGGILVTGAFDRVTMRWRDECPDFVA